MVTAGAAPIAVIVTGGCVTVNPVQIAELFPASELVGRVKLPAPSVTTLSGEMIDEVGKSRTEIDDASEVVAALEVVAELVTNPSLDVADGRILDGVELK